MPEKIDIQKLMDFNPDDAVAVHGTSAEAVKILLETGVLPSSEKRWADVRNLKNLTDYKIGNLYFAPFKLKFKYFEFYERLDKFHEKSFESGVYGYANRLAAIDYLVKNIGFEPKDYPGDYFEDGCYYPCGIDEKPSLLIEAEEHGMTENEFREFLNDAWNKTNGVLLYMSPNFLNLPICYETSSEISVYAPNGLGLRNILGIKPLGEYESGVLERIVS